MTNDWCMYCFSEGLRKLVDLNIPLLFIFNDVAVVRELNSHQAIVGHVAKVLVPLVQTKDEQLAILRKIRLFLPAAHAKNGSGSVGMRSPMLSDAEEMDSKSIRSENYGGTSTKYTFEKSPAAHDVVMDDVTIHDVNDDEMQFDDEMDQTDPKSIKVHHYQPRKDFYSLTVSDM
uniref:Uncharacterized protein n=1 Tax=Ciona savignyi TaxID=51511 RepID=H2YCL1_CIOSA